jgi:hypothetical protein
MCTECGREYGQENRGIKNGKKAHENDQRTETLHEREDGAHNDSNSRGAD